MNSNQHLSFPPALVTVNLISNAGGVLSHTKINCGAGGRAQHWLPAWVERRAEAWSYWSRASVQCLWAHGICVFSWPPCSLAGEGETSESNFLSPCEIMSLHSRCVGIIRAQQTRGVMAVAGLLLVSSNSSTC